MPSQKLNKQDLLKRLSDIEWDDFEVKKATSELPKNTWETVCAFSNTSGGWIVFGVSQIGKKFEILGVEHPEKLEQDLITTLRSQTKFNVRITPECKKYTIDKKKVLAFYIPSADQKPVYYNSIQNTFIRTGSGDQRATDYEINALFREQSLEWKEETHQDVTVETSVDKTKITFMLQDGKVYLSGDVKQQENDEKTAEKQPESNRKTTRKTTGKQPENNQKTTRKNTDVKNSILSILKVNPTISRIEMVKQLSISEGSIRHHIEKLKKENIIRREGADKGGKWIILDQYSYHSILQNLFSNKNAIKN